MTGDTLGYMYLGIELLQIGSSSDPLDCGLETTIRKYATYRRIEMDWSHISTVSVIIASIPDGSALKHPLFSSVHRLGSFDLSRASQRSSGFVTSRTHVTRNQVRRQIWVCCDMHICLSTRVVVWYLLFMTLCLLIFNNSLTLRPMIDDLSNFQYAPIWPI